LVSASERCALFCAGSAQAHQCAAVTHRSELADKPKSPCRCRLIVEAAVWFRFLGIGAQAQVRQHSAEHLRSQSACDAHSCASMVDWRPQGRASGLSTSSAAAWSHPSSQPARPGKRRARDSDHESETTPAPQAASAAGERPVRPVFSSKGKRSKVSKSAAERRLLKGQRFAAIDRIAAACSDPKGLFHSVCPLSGCVRLGGCLVC
jgi:hypothetical protein